MTVDDRLIERIVSDVLVQLQTRPERVPTDGRVEQTHRAERAVATNGRLVLNEKVVTGDLLEQRLNGNKQVVIGPRTILTPSARDFLRTRNIDWSRGEPAHDPQTKQIWEAIVSRSTPAVVSALDEAACSQALRWKRELVRTPKEAAAAAIGAVGEAEVVGAVVFAEAAEAVACLANRDPRIRAAVVSDGQRLDLVRQQMGANLICVNSDGKSYFELRTLLRKVTAGPAPQAPKDWNG